jgi:hypothetical protein
MTVGMKIALLYIAIVIGVTVMLASSGDAATPIHVFVDEAESRTLDSNTFYNAYVLQEVCFRGSKPNSEAARTEIIMCTSYISGSIDTLYAAYALKGEGCPIKVEMKEIMERLAWVFSQVADEKLKVTSASMTVMGAVGMTKAGRLCFGGSGGIAL